MLREAASSGGKIAAGAAAGKGAPEAEAEVLLRAVRATKMPTLTYEDAQRFTELHEDMQSNADEDGKRPAALLSDESAFVEDYLGVARERYENPLEFRCDLEPALRSIAVPPLVLQPLVENSLKHGVAASGAALHMSLAARIVDDWLELEFADDGQPHGNGRPGLGVGLENLEQRVHRFAGEDARVTSGPRDGGGFVVRMRWPYVEGGT